MPDAMSDAASPEASGQARADDRSALRIAGVTIRFGGVSVVRDISLTIPVNGRISLIGPNGAGKSSIINVISGAIRPAAGRVYLRDNDVSAVPAYRRARAGLGRTYQNLELFSTMTVAENLRVPLEARHGLLGRKGLGRRRRLEEADQVEECLATLGLSHYARRRVDELSYGLRKLVEVGRCIVCKPSVVLLDEPAAGLDKSEKREFAERLDRLIEQTAMSVLLVEHDMATVQRLCSDDVYVLDAGRIIAHGIIVASRLSELPELRVALIEAGPDYPSLETLPDELRYGNATAAYVATHGHMWGYQAIAAAGQDPRPLPRGKVVGGTSAINGQVFLRGLRDDFRAWAAAGNDLWSYEELLPSMRAIENDLDFDNEWHGTSGPITVRRYPESEWLAPQAAFYQACRTEFPGCPDANAPDATGAGPIPFNNVGGIRASTAMTYLAAARHRPNLTVIADTRVLRLRIAGSRVVGVDAERDGVAEVIHAGTVVVSAGVIATPQLLMLSGIGDPALLAGVGIDPVAQLPAVGQNLADHQVADLIWEVDPDLVRVGQSTPRVQVALRYTAPGSADKDDMQITVRTAAPGRHGEPLVSLVPAIELPYSAGSVRLTSADPAADPVIELRFLSEQGDLDRLGSAVQLAVGLSREKPLAGMLGRRVTLTDRELAEPETVKSWLRQNVRTSHHTGGTCRMGPPDNPGTVVDQHGRVHGVANLYVADASVFPRMVRANTAVTAMTVGERIAQFARRELENGVPA
jgi:choline dehydrogenase